MRRAYAAGLLLVLLMHMLTGAVAEQVRYTAHAGVHFFLRTQAQDKARRLRRVPKGTQVQVLSIGEDWAQVALGKERGYAKRAWLERFVALEPGLHTVPGYAQQDGIARVRAAFLLEAPGYAGNQLMPKDVIAARYDPAGTLVADIMRDCVTLPQHSVDFMPFVPWQQAQPGALIYGYTTYHNQQTGGRLAEARRRNIQLAVDRVQGTMVAPDGQFSFNALCGPYLPSNGYVMGPNISSDGKGWGGGVCQVSTTLYNAALGLPIAVEQWAIHRKSGVNYVPQFFDASVGLYSDLRLRNLLPYTICLEVLAQEGALTVLIYRAQDGCMKQIDGLRSLTP